MAATAALHSSLLHGYGGRNNFSFLGLSEFLEEPDYLKVFEFEKQDFLPLYLWMEANMSKLMALGPIYALAMLALQRWMLHRKPFQLRGPLMLWSASLALLSMTMFARILPEFLYLLREFGFYGSYCTRYHTNSATFFWAFVYFFSKIVEFGDTVFIVLRKKELTFLHVFHHTSVFIACVLGIVRGDPAARYYIILNTFVHSVMYSYYALKAAQFKLPRKLAMAVTSVQLVQFVIANLINMLMLYAKFTDTQPRCERTDQVSAFYVVLTLVYLYLFGSFFVQNYISKKKGSEKAKLQ